MKMKSPLYFKIFYLLFINFYFTNGFVFQNNYLSSINESLFLNNESTKPKLISHLSDENVFLNDLDEFQIQKKIYFCVSTYQPIKDTNVFVLDENGTYLYGRNFTINVNVISVVQKNNTILMSGSNVNFIFVTDFNLNIIYVFTYSDNPNYFTFVYFDQETDLIYFNVDNAINVLYQNFTRFQSFQPDFCEVYKYLTSFNGKFYLSCTQTNQPQFDTGSIMIFDKKSLKLINSFGINLCDRMQISNKTYIETRFSVDAEEKVVFACMHDDYSYRDMNLVDSKGNTIGGPIATHNFGGGVLFDSMGRLIIANSNGLGFYY